MVEGDENTALVPEDRYAQMRNVWFLPSVPALERWLRRAGFVDVRCVDVSVTSVEEQRSTDWMRYQSLPDFLDPQDHGRTVEGLPAPCAPYCWHASPEHLGLMMSGATLRRRPSTSCRSGRRARSSNCWRLRSRLASSASSSRNNCR